MKAIVYRRYGGPDVLRVEEVDRPSPAAGEVLIRVRAVEATKSDCEMRSFRFSVSWFWLPLRLAMGVRAPKRTILGGYFSGVVEAVGAGVDRFEPGDEVYGAAKLRLGAYGEYVTLPADYTIAAKPRNMTFEEAAAVPLGGFNALHFLRKADVKSGQRVLINGAGGSIGAHGVQIAKHLGAEVTAVDSTIKEAMLRRIGADHFIDYTRENFGDGERTYDVVFDMVSGSSWADIMRALKPGGCYVTANPSFAVMIRSVFATRFTDRTAMFAFAAETIEELESLTQMIEAGAIGSIVDRVLPIEEAAEAHRLVETEQRLGAIVLSFADPGTSPEATGEPE